MMRARLLELREQRGVLLARAAAERAQVGAAIDRADAATGWLVVAARLGEEALRRPLFIVAGAAFFLALRPRRTLGLLLRGWSLYQLYRRGRGLWERLSSRVPAPSRAS